MFFGLFLFFFFLLVVDKKVRKVLIHLSVLSFEVEVV